MAIIYHTQELDTHRYWTLESALSGTSSKLILALIKFNKGLMYPLSVTPPFASTIVKPGFIKVVSKHSSFGHPERSLNQSSISSKQTATITMVLSDGRWGEQSNELPTLNLANFKTTSVSQQKMVGAKVTFNKHRSRYSTWRCFTASTNLSKPTQSTKSEEHLRLKDLRVTFWERGERITASTNLRKWIQSSALFTPWSLISRLESL